jgi:hypothetical protein
VHRWCTGGAPDLLLIKVVFRLRRPWRKGGTSAHQTFYAESYFRLSEGLAHRTYQRATISSYLSDGYRHGRTIRGLVVHRTMNSGGPVHPETVQFFPLYAQRLFWELEAINTPSFCTLKT